MCTTTATTATLVPTAATDSSSSNPKDLKSQRSVSFGSTSTGEPEEDHAAVQIDLIPWDILEGYVEAYDRDVEAKYVDSKVHQRAARKLQAFVKPFFLSLMIHNDNETDILETLHEVQDSLAFDLKCIADDVEWQKEQALEEWKLELKQCHKVEKKIAREQEKKSKLKHRLAKQHRRGQVLRKIDKRTRKQAKKQASLEKYTALVEKEQAKLDKWNHDIDHMVQQNAKLLATMEQISAKIEDPVAIFGTNHVPYYVNHLQVVVAPQKPVPEKQGTPQPQKIQPPRDEAKAKKGEPQPEEVPQQPENKVEPAVEKPQPQPEEEKEQKNRRTSLSVNDRQMSWARLPSSRNLAQAPQSPQKRLSLDRIGMQRQWPRSSIPAAVLKHISEDYTTCSNDNDDDDDDDLDDTDSITSSSGDDDELDRDTSGKESMEFTVQNTMSSSSSRNANQKGAAVVEDPVPRRTASATAGRSSTTTTAAPPAPRPKLGSTKQRPSFSKHESYRGGRCSPPPAQKKTVRLGRQTAPPTEKQKQQHKAFFQRLSLTWSAGSSSSGSNKRQ